MDSKIHKRLVSFVSQMQEGPLGRIPLDRAIKANLDLFVTMRQTGATWVQIANALTSAGARRSDGRFISADHLRSAVSRQLGQGLEKTNNDNQGSHLNRNRREPNPITSVLKQAKSFKTLPHFDAKIEQTHGESDRTRSDQSASIQKKLDRIRNLREK